MTATACFEYLRPTNMLERLLLSTFTPLKRLSDEVEILSRDSIKRQ